MAISRNTAAWSEEGIALLNEFREVAGWKKKVPQKSGDEIVAEVVNKAGLTVVK